MVLALGFLVEGLNFWDFEFRIRRSRHRMYCAKVKATSINAVRENLPQAWRLCIANAAKPQSFKALKL